MPGTRTGAANSWSIMTADPARHLVFVPTGSPSPDYFGGERKGDNRHAKTITAVLFFIPWEAWDSCGWLFSSRETEDSPTTHTIGTIATRSPPAPDGTVGGDLQV